MIVCPNKCPAKTFFATAIVTECWKVDELGDFLEVVEGETQVLNSPSTHSYCVCVTCGEEATVEN